MTIPSVTPPLRPNRKERLAARVAEAEKDRDAGEAALAYFKRQPGVADARLLVLSHRTGALRVTTGCWVEFQGNLPLQFLARWTPV